ncbi:dihydroorotate dehydrogenase electron transfer subunit [Virgibacillus phasianinus]|uniref:Dihydroorotate dehydrogenase B (NAD(+)), electron transfer subunit n=1 Tax=Virgibacillus phasianinus TaxID=2017483 RepID=A0A220U641_9BACI|nr:dihydroorotate dehydrogenase electron transfer subunit [Virgibacillus phasianinus]ASK63560.1 dihydroorotate dehydrogenase electron transfer subunit [Virgibacillus phasianinus]
MIRKENLLIVKSTEIARETTEMVLQNQHISRTAQPGQFLHIGIEGHTLRRPISIAKIDKKNETVTVLFKQLGEGTKALSNYQEGMQISALGPSGNGFPYDNLLNKTILLVGGGIGIPPLYCLGKELAAEGVTIKAVLGFQTADSVFYEAAFKELGETLITTNDGSYGHHGFVTDVIGKMGDYDCYYTCGPMAMLQAVTTKLEHQSGYVSLEERMGCGVGACFACVIPTETQGGYRKICKDGPVFAANEVKL